ncbi:MAG: YhbY family RNA-binding protein [Candidatus Kariarchaeaceae archaeon]
MTQNLKEIIHGKVHLQIGKKGASAEVIKQIEHLFKNNRYLKIRFLDIGEFESVENAIQDLIQKVKCKKIDKRGNTVVLERRKS